MKYMRLREDALPQIRGKQFAWGCSICDPEKRPRKESAVWCKFEGRVTVGRLFAGLDASPTANTCGLRYLFIQMELCDSTLKDWIEQRRNCPEPKSMDNIGACRAIHRVVCTGS